MSNFAGVTFQDQPVYPAYDAIIRRGVLYDGILTGCELSHTGSTLTMTAGQLMICGRQVKHPSTQNWSVAEATSGFARLLLTVDLTRTSSKDAFDQVVDTIEYASAVDGFAELVQDDINASGTKYQIAAAVVSLASGGISGIVSQLPQTSAGLGDKSVIIVKAPSGSTVTCSKGDIVKRTLERNGEWRFNGLDIGLWLIKAEKDSETPATQEFEIKEFGVYRVTLAFRMTPEFTYTGDYEIVQDDDTPIYDFATWKGPWKIRFLTSGTFTVTKMYGWDGRIDLFLVGGGGGGRAGVSGQYTNGGAGGAGYTLTEKNIFVEEGIPYQIDIGSGGAERTKGGTSSAFTKTITGGTGASNQTGAPGGSGGGAGRGGKGGSDGSDGGKGTEGEAGGKGQGSTTKEFGEENGTLYAGGGGGVGASAGAGGGKDNTGGGGNGSRYGGTGGRGYSGIVIIRNARAA